MVRLDERISVFDLGARRQHLRQVLDCQAHRRPDLVGERLRISADDGALGNSGRRARSGEADQCFPVCVGGPAAGEAAAVTGRQARRPRAAAARRRRGVGRSGASRGSRGAAGTAGQSSTGRDPGLGRASRAPDERRNRENRPAARCPLGPIGFAVLRRGGLPDRAPHVRGRAARGAVVGDRDVGGPAPAAPRPTPRSCRGRCSAVAVAQQIGRVEAVLRAVDERAVGRDVVQPVSAVAKPDFAMLARNVRLGSGSVQSRWASRPMSRPRPFTSIRSGPPSGNRSMFSIDSRSVMSSFQPMRPEASLFRRFGIAARQFPASANGLRQRPHDLDASPRFAQHSTQTGVSRMKQAEWRAEQDQPPRRSRFRRDDASGIFHPWRSYA